MMMKWHIFVAIILIKLKTFDCNTIEISSYSKVIKNGFPSTTAASISISSTATEQQEHVKPHGREGVTTSELWFPKIFDVNNKTSESTGRSVDANRPFPFPLKDFHFPTNNNRPSNHRSSHHEPRIIYAASPVSQIAQDRFVPRESLDHFIDKNNKNRVKFSPVLKESDREDDGLSTSSQQNVGPVYTPPKDTYAFPPNKDSLYSPPDIRKPISVSSYLPPPSGPSPYPIYAGPTNPINISPLNTQTDNNNGDGKNLADNDDKMQSNDNNDSDSDRPSDDMKSIDRPQSDFMPSKKPLMPSFPFLDNSDSSNDDDSVDDHVHHHNHDHYHDDHSFIDSNYPIESDSFKHLHGFDSYPEIILDHDPHHFHDDHHHHFHHPLPPPTTTQAPLPPPPPEEPEEPEMQPRVKKFSYFYLSRSLWYIPLYFTVYFVFYVTWLILQSIGRHEVSLPNHTKSRRSIPIYSHRESVEKINLLTEFVMSQIEDFKEKYLL